MDSLVATVDWEQSSQPTLLVGLLSRELLRASNSRSLMMT
ncbi:hypothetical protein E2C01_065192 [Portunus trituberculatus]|uniref:Uncharacterized protein n=1 Tax=Portunus trituberculatus TaxID=210409 RepID=A0A5B7HQE1_PORTR|nr:hypothetical protein [Portunus trituberculatus]